MTELVILPVTPGAVGAAVATSKLQAQKTIMVTGVTGSVDIEVSMDGTNFCPLATFASDGDKVELAACAYMRVNATNGGAGSAQVMAERGLVRSVVIPSPPANGPGASVDVSDLGRVTTVGIGGLAAGSVNIEISPDDVNWSTDFKTFTADGCDTKDISARFMRAVGQGGSASVAASSEEADGDLAEKYLVWVPNAPPEVAVQTNVFTEWEPLYEEIKRLRSDGQIELEVITYYDTRTLTYDPGGPKETTYTGYAEFPDSSGEPGGYWDLSNVKLISTVRFDVGNFTYITGADNARVRGLDNIFSQRMVLLSNSSVNSWLEQDNAFLTMAGQKCEIFALSAADKPVGKCVGSWGGIGNTGVGVFGPLLGPASSSRPNLAPAWDINGASFFLEIGVAGVRQDSLTDSSPAGDGSIQWSPNTHGYNSLDHAALPGTVGHTFRRFFYNLTKYSNIVKITEADSPYTCRHGDVVLVTPGAAVSVVIPSMLGVFEGLEVTVKDDGGTAGANNITVTGSDGDTVESGVISTNNGFGRWVSDGAGNWSKVG